jgi:hypothetical protein
LYAGAFDPTAGQFEVYLFPSKGDAFLGQDWDKAWVPAKVQHPSLFSVLFGSDLTRPSGNAPITFTRY